MSDYMAQKADDQIEGGIHEWVRLTTENDELRRKIGVLTAALNHSDIQELDCDCGYFPDYDTDPIEEVEHICIKHFAEEALKQVEEDK